MAFDVCWVSCNVWLPFWFGMLFLTLGRGVNFFFSILAFLYSFSIYKRNLVLKSVGKKVWTMWISRNSKCVFGYGFRVAIILWLPTQDEDDDILMIFEILHRNQFYCFGIRFLFPHTYIFLCSLQRGKNDRFSLCITCKSVFL